MVDFPIKTYSFPWVLGGSVPNLPHHWGHPFLELHQTIMLQEIVGEGLHTPRYTIYGLQGCPQVKWRFIMDENIDSIWENVGQSEIPSGKNGRFEGLTIRGFLHSMYWHGCVLMVNSQQQCCAGLPRMRGWVPFYGNVNIFRTEN